MDPYGPRQYPRTHIKGPRHPWSKFNLIEYGSGNTVVNCKIKEIPPFLRKIGPKSTKYHGPIGANLWFK